MKISSPSKRFLLTGLALASVGFVTACYPDEITSVQDRDLVATFYDADYGFSSNRTYAMPDTIIHLCEVVEIDRCIDLSRQFDAQMLAQVATKMGDLGYNRISEADIAAGQEPDVVVLMSALGTRTTIIYTWWPGWGYWPGWGGCCGPGWGWGYPPAVGVSTYETGSVVVTMADPNTPPPDQAGDLLYAPWNGVLQGLLSSTPAGSRITDGINQMFAQSPYLEAGS
jgi:hypothetical protein